MPVTSVCRCGRSSMVECEVVALVTRDRNPSATPAGIQTNIGCVAQRVERLVEAQGAQGRYLPHPPIMTVSCHRYCELQILGDGQFVLVAKLERHPASNRKIWEFESLRGRHLSSGKDAGFQRGFISHATAVRFSLPPPLFAPVAQSGERRLVRSEVVRSKLIRGAT